LGVPAAKITASLLAIDRLFDLEHNYLLTNEGGYQMAYSSKSDLERLDNALDGIDGAKRDTLRKLIVGSAYLVPLVMSFAIDGLLVSPAMASNQTCSTSGADDPNHQSSLSSTTEGGNETCSSRGQLSDRRLKRDIKLVDVLDNGLRLYSYRYIGDQRLFVGVMAQDLLADDRFRHAVVERQGGFLAVNYAALGFEVVGGDEMRDAGNKALALAA
jgi:hypothetical protein